MIAWAHGSAGVVRRMRRVDLRTTVSTTGDILNEWVKRGFVVVQTDYEGLGTPGPNPAWIGESEARSMIDSVRAARNLDPRVGDRWVAMGHSLGGHAALFAADLAARRAPELTLVGAVSMAPVVTLRPPVPSSSPRTPMRCLVDYELPDGALRGRHRLPRRETGSAAHPVGSRLVRPG